MGVPLLLPLTAFCLLFAVAPNGLCGLQAKSMGAVAGSVSVSGQQLLPPVCVSMRFRIPGCCCASCEQVGATPPLVAFARWWSWRPLSPGGPPNAHHPDRHTVV